MVMQIHFATFRNINSSTFTSIGKDSGFDVIRHETNTDNLAYFLDDLNNSNLLPKTILYSLNSNAIKEMSVIAGSFRNVKIGPAWWFNDNLIGNKILSLREDETFFGTTEEFIKKVHHE